MICSACATDLGSEPPDVCPTCFTPVSAGTVASPSVTAVDEARPAAPAPPAEPTAASPSTVACATEGCTGVPPAGAWYCVTCQLVNDSAVRAIVLSGTWGEVSVPDGGDLVIGRSPQDAPATAALLASADRVSRIHATLRRRGVALILVDDSANGTTVNGTALVRGVERIVLPGDRLVFGTQAEFEIREV